MGQGNDKIHLAPEFFFFRYFANGLECYLFAVKFRFGIDNMDLVSDLLQSQCRTRSHIEHSFVAFSVVFHPCGVSTFLQGDGHVKLHVSSRKPEFVSISESSYDVTGDIFGYMHGIFS